MTYRGLHATHDTGYRARRLRALTTRNRACRLRDAVHNAASFGTRHARNVRHRATYRQTGDDRRGGIDVGIVDHIDHFIECIEFIGFVRRQTTHDIGHAADGLGPG